MGGWMDEWMDGWMDRRTGGWVVGKVGQMQTYVPI